MTFVVAIGSRAREGGAASAGASTARTPNPACHVRIPSTLPSLAKTVYIRSAMALDLAGTVRFHVAEGFVEGLAGTRSLLLPSDALTRLLSEIPEKVAEAFGEQVSETFAKWILGRLGGAERVRSETIERVVSEFAGAFAVAGLGHLGFERWGRAMVVVLTPSSAPDAPPAPFVRGILRGLLGRCTGQTLAVTSLGAVGAEQRYLVSDMASGVAVEECLRSGQVWSTALSSVQGFGGADR